MAKYKSYPEYKDSGVEWLGEIPAHWLIKKLKYLCKVQTGSRDTVNAVENGRYPFFVRSQTIERINSVGAECEAVLTAGDGVGVGKVYHYYDGKFDFHQRVYMLNEFHSITGKFVYYYLSSNFYKVALEGNAKSTVDSLRLPQFLNFEFSIPNLDEQKKLILFIEHETKKIDSLIEKQQQLIELLREKCQAVISQAVTKGLNPDVPMKDSGVEWLGEIPSHWEMKRLAYLGSARNGLTYSPENITDQESGVLVLRSSNIQNSSLCFDDNVYVDSIIPEQFLVKENDLLICSRNGSRNLIGKNALISKDAEGMAFGAFMAIFRSQINTYIFWVLNSPLFDYQSGSFLTSTINQLTIGNLNSMEIPVPMLKEQKEIARYLSRKNNDFIALINKVKNSIALLQERRTALISAAVTGKIDVRDWVAPDTQDVEEPEEATA